MGEKENQNNILYIDEINLPFEIAAQEIKNLHINIEGCNNKITLNSNLRISGKLKININGNNHSVYIGKGVFVRRNVSIYFLPGGGAETNFCSINIGDGCMFNGENISFICGEKDTNISVGRDCLFANNIQLITTDNHPIYDLATGKRLNIAGDVKVGNHVWFCNESRVFDNSQVPDGCVVGTRAIVNKKFKQPNCVLAGIPAKIVRENIRWERTFEKEN